MGSAIVDVLWTRPLDVSATWACTPAEQSRIATLLPRDAQLISTGRALLRGAVAAQLQLDPRDVRVAADCPDCGRPHGRPVVALPGAPHASIAHTEGIVLVALTQAGPVGCDVESASAPTPPAMTVRRWTRIEAVAKAFGTGLRVEPSAVELEREDVVIHDFRIEDYLGAVAVCSDSPVALSVRRADDALVRWAVPVPPSRTATG